MTLVAGPAGWVEIDAPDGATVLEMATVMNALVDKGFGTAKVLVEDGAENFIRLVNFDSVPVTDGDRSYVTIVGEEE